MDQNRLLKLARKIDELAAQDDRLVERTREIAELRRVAAVNLYSICYQFVTAIRNLVSRATLELDPAEFGPDSFRDAATNLFQINIRGRIVQIEFETSALLISTEEFRVPYILEGAVRCFNQDLLDRSVIEQQGLYYCLEKKRNVWRYFDQRTHRTGLFDMDYLTLLLEQLL